MKRIISIVASIILLLNMSLAYTTQITVSGARLITTSEEGNMIRIIPKINVEGWIAQNNSVDLTENSDNEVNFSMSSNNIAVYATKVNDDISGANAPKLGESLIPVNWDGIEWVDTTVENWKYNYNTVVTEVSNGAVDGNGDGAWANARTSDGSMYVWIPRYTYKIESGEHQAVKSWNSDLVDGTEETLGKILIKFSDGSNDDNDGGYLSLPAFEDETLEGIWVSKYEASRANATSESAGTDEYNTPTSKPGVVSWTNLTVSEMYNHAYNLNRDLDSHLIKNSEWAAIAYLTNAIGRIPYINNSSSRITGNSGSTQDAIKSAGVTNAWNSIKGVKASTTHNVYGVYDMSGGVTEYVSAYYTGGSNEYMSSLITNKDTQYVDAYDIIYSSEQKGDAIYETTSNSDIGSNSWDGDYSGIPRPAYPLFVRSANDDSKSSAGIFGIYFGTGESAAFIGFRVTLLVK